MSIGPAEKCGECGWEVGHWPRCSQRERRPKTTHGKPTGPVPIAAASARDGSEEIVMDELQEVQAAFRAVCATRDGLLEEIDRLRADGLESVFTWIRAEIKRQDKLHPAGYPPVRDGVRLGIITVQDELDEALAGWREERSVGTWDLTRNELIQTMAVGMRLLRSLEEAR